MTGHVAQYLVAEEAWDELLGQSWRVLAPGGRLAFESRNPAARAWEGWERESTRARYPHPKGGTFTSWVELVRADEHDEHGPVETHRAHTLLPGGEHLEAEETLRFRPLPALVASVEAAGLDLEAAWGEWDGSALRPDSPELILLARRPDRRA